MATPGFAASPDEAEIRFQRHRSSDPFIDIPPALLNSADIFDYVRTTGMVHPFDHSGASLKSASYEVPFLGEVFWWEDSKRQQETIGNGTRYKLKKNSIAFVWLHTVFRLPDYIALRFNFRITHVHRGLLLGTGPLVDPGFIGRILVPLHNLTSEDYILIGGHGLIWVEFTKVSPNSRWDTSSTRPSTNFRAFPDDKKNKEPHYYFEKASGGHPIQSSIPGEVQQAKADAEAAKNSAREARDYVARMRRWIYIGGAATAVSLVAAFAAVVISAISLVSDTNIRFDNIAARLSTLETKWDASARNNDTRDKDKPLAPTANKQGDVNSKGK